MEIIKSNLDENLKKIVEMWGRPNEEEKTVKI